LQGIIPGQKTGEIYLATTVGPYWPPERRWIENGYRDLPFPFPELNTPPFAMTARWQLEQLLGYLSTWSATKRYRSERGTDPLETLRPGVRDAWGLRHKPGEFIGRWR
jgi:hypothetical protein